MSSSLINKRRPETVKPQSSQDDQSGLGRRKQSEYALDGGKSVIIDAPASPSKWHHNDLW